jgi:hypothetical protein
MAQIGACRATGPLGHPSEGRLCLLNGTGRPIGRELNSDTLLAESLLLRTWRGGPHADDATLRDGAMPALADELLKFAPEGPEVGDLALDLRQVS